MIRDWFPTPDLLNFCGFTVGTDFATSLDCSIGAIAEQGPQNIRLLRPRNNPGCSLQELPFPVTPSTAHNRDLSRTALLRLADNLSKWFREQCGVYSDL